VSRRTIAILWLVVGFALWNGIFDLYVARGAREYLQLRAESDIGLVPRPSMELVMARAERWGLIAATLWATGIVACGWITIALVSRTRAPAADPPRGRGTSERSNRNAHGQ
jgi:hypothetical protein